MYSVTIGRTKMTKMLYGRRKKSALVSTAICLAACSSSANAFVQPPAMQYRERSIRPAFSTVEDDTTTASDEVAAAAETTTMPENPRKQGLALMLDDGTRKSHSMAENTAFVSGFFKGIATQSAFGALVTSLYFVYKAQEEAFEKTNDASVKALDYSELRRVSTLEKDMQFFYGDEWETKIIPTTATKKYVARIEEIAKTQPELLIAHQYTRYLGDLFGGQMMGSMAQKSLGLKPGQGTSFYQFDDIDDTKAFIDEWYTNLNKLELTDEQKTSIVDEANLVFALNIEILEELEGSPIKAMMMLAINSLKERLGF